MTVYPIMNVPIEIQRQGTVTDAYGQDRLSAWTTLSTVYGWLDTNMKKVIEIVANRDESTSDGICILPAGTDIVSTDRIQANGYLYQVFGIPSAIVDPRDNTVHHIELRVRRYVG
jgi:hypothetical protein